LLQPNDAIEKVAGPRRSLTRLRIAAFLNGGMVIGSALDFAGILRLGSRKAAQSSVNRKGSQGRHGKQRGCHHPGSEEQVSV